MAVALMTSSVWTTRTSFGVLSYTLVVAVLCVSVASVRVCEALPTRYAVSSSASHDRRVAELRQALLSVHRLEKIPDPPLELGIHTACKKFGRGCPDTYVAFLEDVVASLRPTAEMAEENIGPVDVVAPVITNASSSSATDVEEEAAAEAAVSPSSNPPFILRLPVQISWSYADVKRLESMLVRIKVAELQLDKRGMSSHTLQQRYRVPRGASLALHDDINGEVTTQLFSACLSLAQGRTPFRGSSAATSTREEKAEATAIVEGWCRYMAHRKSTRSEATDGVGLSGPATSAREALFALPRTPLACYAKDTLRCYAHLLLAIDPVLAFLVSWMWRVALPSAAATSVVLWVFVGTSWGGDAEAIIFGAAEAAGSDSEAPDAQEALAERQYRQSRLAGLRFVFLECAQHRSWSLSFLKLRLVLCLLVALSMLWSFGQVLYATLWPAAAGTAMPARGPALPMLIGVVFRLLPVWCQVILNVYVVAALQGAVLVMALKGAADAFTDWQDFTAKCAMEHEYLLKAANDLAQ